VTRASESLGVTQSAVSHMLDKLRAITHDPLFVKSGRGIVATDHAKKLAARARELLPALQEFAQSGAFNPSLWQATITVAANDLQRDLLLPALMVRLRQSAPALRLHVIASNVPQPEMFRDDECLIAITPRPPQCSDVVQKRLFEDQYQVFYDPQVRSAPRTRAQYLAAQHVSVVYAPRRNLDIDQWLQAQNVERDIRVTVPGFAGVGAFIRGTDLLTTAPGYLQRHLLRDLASCRMPINCPGMPMYLVWHMRHQHNPAHSWLRRELEAVAREIT